VTWPARHRDEVRSSLKNLEGVRASPELSGSLMDEYMLSRRIREYSPNTRYLHEYSLSTRVHAEFESYPPRVHQSYAHIERSILFISKLYFLPFLALLRATISLFLKKQEFNFTKITANNQPPPSPPPSTHIPNVHNLQPNFVPFISLLHPCLLQALSNLTPYPFHFVSPLQPLFIARKLEYNFRTVW